MLISTLLYSSNLAIEKPSWIWKKDIRKTLFRECSKSSKKPTAVIQSKQRNYRKSSCKINQKKIYFILNMCSRWVFTSAQAATETLRFCLQTLHVALHSLSFICPLLFSYFLSISCLSNLIKPLAFNTHPPSHIRVIQD